MIPDQGEFALIIETNEAGAPIGAISYTTPALSKCFTEGEVRDIYLAAALNEQQGFDDESQLVLDAYLTKKGGSCEFAGKEQLYQRMEDKVAPPSESETTRREKIETQLLSEKVPSSQRCMDSRHYRYLEPKPGSPREFCDCDSCTVCHEEI